MEIKPSELMWQEAYKLLIGSVLPRPIAFVSTISIEGISNLAPFSFFNGICAQPFMVCFAPMVRGTDGEKKDTLRNIEDTKEFVINMVSEELVLQMNDTAKEFPSHVDEFDEVGLTKEKSSWVKPFRIKESPIHLECTLDQILTFGNGPGSGSLVIGKVEGINVQNELFQNGRIVTEGWNPIGRMAGQVYTRASKDTFILERK